MMKHLIWGLLAALFLGAGVHAQESLPPYHWANSYIDYLKVSGDLPDLLVSERPYYREHIARALLKMNWQSFRADARRDRMVAVLFAEFGPEISRLGHIKGEGWEELIREALNYLKSELLPASVNPASRIGAFGEAFFADSDLRDSDDANLDLHLHGGIYWRDQLVLYHNLRIFDHPDSNYIGKEFSNFYSYAEQAYLGFQRGWVQARIGRDYLQIGPGRSGQLLISGNSRPFDMYHVRLGGERLQFSFWGMALDRRDILNSEGQRSGRVANRYLNGHRLGVNIQRKYYIGFSEVAVYGGEDRPWEFGFSNPLGFYYGYNVNLEDAKFSGNILYNLDWDLYPRPGLEIYGELLIDDLQVDRESAGDLEPSEYAFLLGANISDPGGWRGSQLNLEYVQVRNRTYNVQNNNWDKYLHRNAVIGYAPGNNLARWKADLSWWARGDLRLAVGADIIRQGEGTVAGEFNTDFRNATLEEGYNEAFPFGVVERQLALQLTAFYKPSPHGDLRFSITRRNYDNYLHQDGRSESDVELRAGIWLQMAHFRQW